MTSRSLPGEGSELTPEFMRDTSTDHHHEVVMPVRDVTRSDGPELPWPAGTDTAWRVVFPITYDIVLDRPEATQSGQDE